MDDVEDLLPSGTLSGQDGAWREDLEVREEGNVICCSMCPEHTVQELHWKSLSLPWNLSIVQQRGPGWLTGWVGSQLRWAQG